MVPTRLVLQQFLCYREPVEIDFTGLHFACLSGENGAGKSALLDAITWALWEEARAENHHLITVGQAETRVEFRFRLEGKEYRVLRAYNTAARTRSLLELSVRQGEHWRPLAAGGRNTVQREISRLLGVSYTTFVNSVFLIQGRADEFTRQPPAKRKSILAELLELERYERYRELARDERRRMEDEKLRREQELAVLLERASAIPQLREKVAALERAVLHAQEVVTRQRDELTRWQERVYRLTTQVERYREKQARWKEVRQRVQELATKRDQLMRAIEHHQEQLKREGEIRVRVLELQEVRNKLKQLAQVALQRQTLLEQRHKVEMALEARQRDFQSELQTLEAHIVRLERELGGQRDLFQEQQRLIQEIARLEQFQAEQRALTDRLADLAAQKSDVEAQGRQLRKERDELSQKATQLASIDAVCPVCLRPLSAVERARQLRTVQEQQRALEQHIVDLRVAYRRLESESEAIRERLEHLDHQLAQLQLLQSKRGEISAQLAQIDRHRKEVIQLRQRYHAVKQAEQNDALLRELREHQQLIEHQLTALDYDPAAHATIEQRLRELEGVEREQQELERARVELSYCKRELEALTQQEEQALKELEWLSKELEMNQSLERELAEAKQFLESARTVLAEAEEVLQTRQTELGAARQRLTDAEVAEQEAQEARRLLDRVGHELVILEELERAFSKHGIQALILENVLPELAELANDILDRLPGNTLRLDFETQRERQSGDGAVETLEILISDEHGRRPYELFSGGEAFRINFALRIALSLLLTQRAGRRLETLVIDEGFGTQDAKGREGLMQALQAVHDQFSLILVVTHLDELKEQFPQRIEVYRTVNGSRVTVVN